MSSSFSLPRMSGLRGGFNVKCFGFIVVGGKTKQCVRFQKVSWSCHKTVLVEVVNRWKSNGAIKKPLSFQCEFKYIYFYVK